jgi:hypothetical protein
VLKELVAMEHFGQMVGIEIHLCLPPNMIEAIKCEGSWKIHNLHLGKKPVIDIMRVLLLHIYGHLQGAQNQV